MLEPLRFPRRWSSIVQIMTRTRTCASCAHTYMKIVKLISGWVRRARLQSPNSILLTLAAGANASLMLTACAFGHVVCDGPARLYRPALACHSPFPPAIFAPIFCCRK